MKKLVLFIVFILINFMISCTGPQGPVGPAGKDGAPGKDGVNQQSDKQIRIDSFREFANPTTKWLGYPEILNFDIRNYSGVDSIIFVAYFYSSADTTNVCIAELYNCDDNTTIQKSTIQTNPNAQEIIYFKSGNLYQSFPSKEIDVGVRIRNTNAGAVSIFSKASIFLYRK